jgi:uncharacterized protein YukJ
MSKYNAVLSYSDGIRFASKKEMYRYNELQLLVKAGEIGDLKLQVKYPLVVNGIKICDYFCDFQYLDYRTMKTITEDAKGVKTPVYRLKCKLMKACRGIDILET